MAQFAAQMQRTASSSASVGSINAAASNMRRVKIFFVEFGSEGSPADVANLWQYQRITTAGTSTAVTPAPLDSADSQIGGAVGQAHSVEPTYTANTVLLSIALNQKATLQWQAPPGGELVIPATASNGIGVKTPTAGSSVAITATNHFWEL